MYKFPIKEFLIGGVLFSAIKYSTDNIQDIRVSSMIAAFPVGLLSSLLINNKKIKGYSKSYMVSISILFLTSIAFYLLHYYTGLNRYINLLLAIFIWSIVNYLNIEFL
tara:strand:+ start:229 stop:552 length:324 start_codon:yes stop_codon:yes gene_type:complete